MTNKKTGPIAQAIEDIRLGKPIILVDDDDRENEGDMVFAASKCTPELINMMMSYGRGLICQPMTAADTMRLKLPQQVISNEAHLQTAFTISIDATHGIGTGISATDRCTTVRAACANDAKSDDLVRPGHIFPLEAKEGGCLVRPGHTEASVDLVKLAGLGTQAVICEIMDNQGEASKLPELLDLAETLGIGVYTIHDLVNYRLRTEAWINKVETVNLPTEYGVFKLHIYQSGSDDNNESYLVLTHSEEKFSSEIPLVRVHAEWSLSNIINRLSHNEGSRLNLAMKNISESGCGALLFLRHIPAPHLDSPFTTKAYPPDIWEEEGALKTIGFDDFSGGYGLGAQILRDLGVRKMNILSNNDSSFKGISAFDLEINQRIPFGYGEEA
ncbi:MAG: 3,4-dihydroxy-2-butanone-4-phosphate synthase [Planctomycetes bacterium]|nr:3,4-dihydroxy-2-butanone-4-phosphate synthase [Planctomycetota bacterium]